MPEPKKFINVLIAEDNVVSRELMASILKPQGYHILYAEDGDSAIDVMRDHVVDLAFVDINMAPKGGFELIKHMVANNIKVPVIIVTADTSADILLQANTLGVEKVFQKPIDPDRFLEMARRVLKQHGHNVDAIFKEAHETILSHEDLMGRAIDLAQQNIEMKKGGPFGAVVADQEGRVLGEGTNGISSRVDPIAHAEVMAIRQAAEKLGRGDLSDCVLYCSSEPTMMGKALVISVGIPNVYFGLAHKDTGATRDTRKTGGSYTQLEKERAMAVFQQWKNMPEEHKARLKD